MLGDLAIAGGRPQFTEPVHVGRPNIGRRDRLYSRIDSMLDRNWLTNNGPLVAELEEAFAHKHQVRGAVAVNNATLGLQLLARAVGIAGEVLMPSFTFVATAHAMTWQGARPRFVDILAGDHNIDAASVEGMVDAQTGGIVGVHLWGRPCDVERLELLAAQHHLPLIFDAAHAVGVATSPRGPVGSAGLAEVLSLHATKFLNSFEGGIVLSNDPALLDDVRSLRNFGFADYDTVTALGTNAKMPEICAAMGLTSLESIDEFTEANRLNYEAYRASLAGAPGLRLLDYVDGGTWNYQYVVVEIEDPDSGGLRDAVVNALHAENVMARRYFYPGCHRHEPYRSREDINDLPVTERVSKSVVVLPTGTALSDGDCTVIARLVLQSLSERARIANRSLGEHHGAAT